MVRSVLLLALIVAMGAGITAYAIGHAFAPMTGASSSTQTQQTASTSSTTAHNCPWQR